MIRLFKKRQKKTTEESRYEGFDHCAGELSAFAIVQGIFILSLKKTDNIVKHKPENVERFYHWLRENGVREIHG